MNRFQTVPLVPTKVPRWLANAQVGYSCRVNLDAHLLPPGDGEQMPVELCVEAPVGFMICA